MPRARGITVGAVVAIAIGIATAVWVSSSTDPRSVPVPERGDVAAAFVGGHPVFVVHDEDGEVRVLDAVSPHDTRPKVLAFCRSSGWFEDLWHGATFTRDGQWFGGPAPSGMAAYETTEDGRDRVLVGERGTPPPKDGPGTQPREEALGPRCDERTAVYLPGHEPDPGVLQDLVVHEPTGGDVEDLWYPTPAVVLGEQEPGR